MIDDFVHRKNILLGLQLVSMTVDFNISKNARKSGVLLSTSEALSHVFIISSLSVFADESFGIIERGKC